MRIREMLGRLDRAQRSRRYKIVASVVIAVVSVALYVTLVVLANEPGSVEGVLRRSADRARESASGLVINEGPLSASRRAIDALLLTIHPPRSGAEAAPGGPAPGVGAAPDVATPGANAGVDVQGPQGGGAGGAPGETAAEAEPAAPLSGALLVAGVFVLVSAGALAVVWLGLSLTYLSLLLVGWGIAWPLMLWPAASGLGTLLLAATPLLLAFLTGMELLRLSLGGPWPVLAVARNVLSEAVRMEISLVFIVMLLILLAYVPSSLNEAQPLRYRVQQWLQYGTGLSYALLALLTLFLSVATVSFEQRDRIIWQTMTKPVAPWQYLLGKWIGVMGLTAVLLFVTAGGVYLFTEYLRHQPAQGELAYQVRDDGTPTRGRPDLMSEDRRLLDTQVLVARRSSQPARLMGEVRLSRAVDMRVQALREQDSSFQDTAEARARLRDELLSARVRVIEESVDEMVKDAVSRDPSTRDTPAFRESLRSEIVVAQEMRYRTIIAGQSQEYFFTGLQGVHEGDARRTLTLRFKINSGSNDPAKIYRLGFLIGGVEVTRQVALKASQLLTFDAALVDQEGNLSIEVFSFPENDREISLPDDGLEVLYVAGGYEVNFLRIMLVMWVKLGFIAAVGVAAATFTSFPVACLMAMTVLFAAESAGFLSESLEYYTSKTQEGIDYMAVAVRVIAVPIAGLFKSYSELKPTANLVDGRLVGWGSLVGTLVLLGTWTLGVLGLGWAIFRRRELAVYSGRT